MKVMSYLFLILFSVTSLMHGQIAQTDQQIIDQFKKQINAEQYQAANKTFDTQLMPILQKHFDKTLAEIKIAEHPSQSKSITSQATEALNALNAITKELDELFMKVTDKYDAFNTAFFDELLKHLPKWLAQKTPTGNPQFAQQWSTILDIMRKTNGVKALQISEYILPLHIQVIRIEQKARHAYMHAFLEKQGW